MSLRVYIRNAALTRVAEAADRSDLSCHLIENDIGAWGLTMPAASDAALALTYSGGVEIWRQDDTDRSAPPVLLTSGQPTKMRVQSRRLDRRRVVEDLVVVGEDDNALLNRRLALPSPTAPAGGPYPDDYDDQTGPVETVARAFIDRNLGPGAIRNRRVPDLELEPDGARGPSRRGRPDRYDNLLAFLREYVAGSGVSFRVVQDGRRRVVRFSEGRDLSRAVVFGLDRGNLLDYSYETSVPTANYLYAGGQGDLAARLIAEDSDPESIAIYDRREAFLDERSAPDLPYLQQKIGASLTERSANSGLTITPIDGPDTRLGIDYWLGDTVAVRLRDPHGSPGDVDAAAIITDRVAGVKVAEGADGRETLSPIVASDGANLSGLDFVNTLRRLRRSVTRLESRT